MGYGLFLARAGLVPVPLGLLGGGEEEGPGHLVEGGAAQAFQPNGTMLPPVDTTDGAPLYPGGVGYVDDRHDDRILGTVVLLLDTFGGVGLGRGGGGTVLEGLVGLGAEPAFVGGAVVVGGGGMGEGGRLLLRGFAALSLSEPDSRQTVVSNVYLRVVGRGWVASWPGGGGAGAVVVDAPPPLLVAHPTPSHAPPQPLILPPPPHTPLPASGPTRWAESDATSPKRRSPHARSPTNGDLAREEGPRVGVGP